VGLWDKVSSIFLPVVPFIPPRSVFADDPQGVRKERPMPTTTTTRWLQDDITRATLAADNGLMGPTARLARSLKRDGTLGGILATRTSGLTRLPKQFRGTPHVVEAFENRHGESGLFDKVFRPSELSVFLADWILCGVAVGELVYLPDRPNPVFVRLDPEFLRYQWGDDRWYYDSVGGTLPITPGNGRWILATRGYQTPWNNGLWPGLGRSFIAKDHGFNYRENYCSKLANPARAAVSPLGASEPQRRGFLSRLIAWGPNAVFDLPIGWDVKLIEVKGEGTKVFQDVIDSSDKEFMIMLAGQIVTITGGAGFANADIHATIRSDLIQEDGDGLCADINEQALPHVVNKMFGAAARLAVAIDTQPPGNLIATATSISSAAQAIQAANVALAPYGLQIDAREICTRHRIPVLASTTPAGTLQSPQAAPSPGGTPDAKGTPGEAKAAPAKPPKPDLALLKMPEAA
jgi:hypothetical protein